MTDVDEIERSLQHVGALLRSVDGETMSVRAGPIDVVHIARLVDAITSERAKRDRVEHALADALDRADRFEAQAAEHWLRLARCRGALYTDVSFDEKQAVLKATATDDAPAMEAIDRARARLEQNA